MPRVRLAVLVVVLLGIAALAAGWLLYQRSVRDLSDQDPDVQAIDTSGLIGRPRPDFTLPDLDGVPRQAASWDGSVTVVNFWATWCEPCRREMPALVELQKRYGSKGLQVVGIALDDRQAVRRFVADLGTAIDYPLLADGEAPGIEVAKQYGNSFGILPYTVVVGRDRRIAFVQLGELTLSQAERVVRGLL